MLQNEECPIFATQNYRHMGRIDIEGMEFYAYHGHFRQEQVVGNKFLLNVTIEADCDRAGETDHLNDALDYQKVYLLIKEEMEIKSYLLENICKRILDRLYREFSTIRKATIQVAKINPPLGGQIKQVSVTMSR